MKTQLPEKIENNESYVAYVLNQLIDVVAELTTVVEGRQDNPLGDWADVKIPTADDIKTTPTPTLKETLLGEIMDLFIRVEEREDQVELLDVAAIINRLMP